MKVTLKLNKKEKFNKFDLIVDKEMGVISRLIEDVKEDIKTWDPYSLDLVDDEGRIVSSTDSDLELPRPSSLFIDMFIKKRGIDCVILETNDDGSIKTKKNRVVIRPNK